MTVQPSLLWIIIGCALVTWIPRILPFAFVRNMKLPDVVLRWLSYIPVCILSALVIEQIFHQGDTIVTIDWEVFLAFIPTLLVAIFSKSLLWTVVIGVITMAVVRMFI